MTTDDLSTGSRTATARSRFEPAIGGATLAVLISGFLPWFQSGWAASTNGVNSYETNRSAWAASTAWSMALMLSATSGAAAILPARIDRQPPRWASLRWAPPTLSFLGIVFVLWTWIDIPRADTVGAGGWTTGSGGHIGDIAHDRLQILHLDGLRYDVGWGLYIGILAMSSLCALLVGHALRARRHAARSCDDARGSRSAKTHGDPGWPPGSC
ncbi:hypothetical protein [Micromonospora sp. MA102]|uniref:hypothetical protein n=1 Tax=Micromonospora sp. MA102 TaxID=2952755 RepID=UPI0021C6B882|nr:hypothetical protein [Micromonospora sp. MA102]